MPSTTFEFKSSGLAEIIRGYNDLAKSQQELDRFIQNVAKSFQQQGQSQKEAIANARALAEANGITAKTFTEISAQQKASSDGAARAATAIKQQAEAVKQQQAANAQLTTTLKGNEGAIASLTTAFSGNAKSANEALQRYKELQQAGVSLGGTQKALATELGVTDKQFAAVAKSAGASRESLLAIAGVATGVAAGLGAIAVSGVKAFAEFDKAIRTFGVVTQSTGTPQLAALRQEVERLAKETTQTPQDIAKLSVELGKAGFNADQTKQALAGVVQSSEATGEGLVRTGEVIGATLNQFGLKATDSLKIADLLTTASNASAAGTNSLGDSLSYVGAAAKTSNQSVEDTIGTLALLANAGITGSGAGTGLAEALRRISLASASASTELDDLRSRGSKGAIAAFDRLNESVRDSSGKLIPFPQIVEKVRTGLQGLEKEGDKELLRNALFGVQGGRVINSLLGQTKEQIDQVTGAMANYEGASAKASKEMTQGLAGSLKLFESSLQLSQQKIGEFLAIGLTPLVQGANAVISTFLDLPAPLQIAVVGIGGLTAALAAAVAIIATYQALNIAFIAGQALATTATIAQSLATGTASGVMLLFNTQLSIGTLASSALAAGQSAAAAAMGVFSGAAGAATISAGGLATALVAVLAPLLVIGAGIALTGIVQMTDQLADQTNRLNEIQASTDAALQTGINAQQKLRGAIDAVNAAKAKGVALSEEDRKKVQEAFEQAKKTLPLLQQQLKENKAVPEAKAGVGGLGEEEAQAQNNARNAAIKSVENQIAAIGRMEKTLQSESGISKDNAKATDDNAKARRKSADAIKDEAEEAKKARDEAKRQADEAFKDSETSTKRSEDDGKRDRDAAFNKEAEAVKLASEKRISDQKKRDEKEISDQKKRDDQEIADQKKRDDQESADLKKRTDAEIQTVQKQFDTEQAASKKQNEAELAAFKKEQERALQAEEKAFTQSQQKEEREFKRSLSKETKEAEKGFDKEQKAIDRQIERATAKPEDRAKLTKQFADEDRETALREKLEAPLRKKREEFEAAQQAKEEAFRELQQAKKVEFEETVLAPKRIALEEQVSTAKALFEEQLNAKKLQFEEQTIAPLRAQQEAQLTALREQSEARLGELKVASENRLTLLKEASEARLAELKKAADDELAARKKTFADAERAIERQQEDARRDRERAFKDQERKLDEASAEKIAQIKKNKPEAASTPAPAPSLPGRKDGGKVDKGRSYIVGEERPEVFVAGANGVILNRQQAIDNIHLLERVGEVRYSPSVVVQAPASTEFGALLKETIALRKVIESRNPAINFPVTFEASDRGFGEYDKFLAFQRSTLRGTV